MHEFGRNGEELCNIAGYWDHSSVISVGIQFYRSLGMLDGLDSRTHFATLVSPILPTCFRPDVKTQQLCRLLNREVAPSGQISLKPLKNDISHTLG